MQWLKRLLCLPLRSFSEERLESLFGRYGDIERVNLLWLSTLPTPGAHILFKSAKVGPPRRQRANWRLASSSRVAAPGARADMAIMQAPVFPAGREESARGFKAGEPAS